ncbi:MAG: ISAzo13 family transposase [Thermoplasmata archaeon]|nr:ISAzo13 family transposase [Thermoplasmata archaeon]
MAQVHRTTDVSRRAIVRGLRELKDPIAGPRIRRPGGGRRRPTPKDPTLRGDLVAFVEAPTSGDPESRLPGTSWAGGRSPESFRSQDPSVSPWLVAELLGELGHPAQGNFQTKEGHRHPDRNARFEPINAQVIAQPRARQPVISVGTKKKELAGEFKNAGKGGLPQVQPTGVRVHDFLIPENGKAIPYGVYDLTRNDGGVSGGNDHDTPSFAVRTIGRWWTKMGESVDPKATSRRMTADSGTSNRARSRPWMGELSRIADRSGLEIRVDHVPTGTSRWNEIEHRPFSFIMRDWRGQPLVSLAGIVNLIGRTRTDKRLRVWAEWDRDQYPDGRQITDEQIARLPLDPATFHGEWNYAIRPRSRRSN